VEEKTKMRKPKKAKRVKLEALPKIRRRLLRLWKEAVRAQFGNCCAVTGVKDKEMVNGKPTILNCHHLESYRMCAFLRYDPMNGILLSPSAHKYGRNSAHQGPIWFAEWLRNNKPMQWAFVLNNRDKLIDLNDRETLATLECRLRDYIAARLTVMAYRWK
jgi:hypothetical protein